MKIADTYSHLNGLEHFLIRKQRLWTEFVAVIKAVNAGDEISQNPAAIKRKFKDAFRARQWRARHMTYWLSDDGYPVRPASLGTASAQKREIEKAQLIPIRRTARFDFVKERVAVGMQLDASRSPENSLFARHHALYMRDEMDVGIEVLLMKEACIHTCPTVDCYEDGIHSIRQSGRNVPSVPMVVVGIAP